MTQAHDLMGLLRPRLEVRHLSALLAVHEAGNVTRAAEMLGITQPALSRQIREAERRLGTALYSREKKRLRPTLAGECLLEHAKRLLWDLRKAEADTVQVPAGPRHLVRLSAGAYSSYFWLPAFFATLQSRAAEIDLAVAGEALQQPADALAQDEIDVAILPGPVERRGLRALHLFDDELLAILPRDHPLAGRAFVEAKDFAELAYITYGPTYQKGFETDRVLRPARVWPRRLIKVDPVDAIIDLVAAGMGVSVLSRWAATPAVEAGSIVALRVTQAGLPIAWSAVVRRSDGEKSPALKLARELVRWYRTRNAGFADSTEAPRPTPRKSRQSQARSQAGP